jgi:hypothetical protein
MITTTVVTGLQAGGRIRLKGITNIKVHRGSNGTMITHSKLMSHLDNNNNNNNNNRRGAFLQRHRLLILATTSIRAVPILVKGAARQVITVNI